MIRKILAAAALALLAGCGDDAALINSGVTPEEASALDETANMLDAAPDDLGVDAPALEPGDARLEDVDNMTAESGDLPVTSEAATGDE